jgi:hypothetical protein
MLIVLALSNNVKLFRCKKKVEIRKPAWSCCHPSSLYTYNVNNVSYNKFGGMIIKKTRGASSMHIFA